MSQIRIGVSGWSYGHWRGRFYPRKLPRSKELEYAAERFNSIEINGSFYSMLKPDTYRRYHQVTPDNFLFAVKASRFITHNKKLKNVHTPLANFFASGVLLLKEKLGPILWQFPQRAIDLARLDDFLAMLPKDTQAASALAKQHDQRVAGRAATQVEKKRRIRYAIEIRDAAHFVPECVRITRRHGAAIVVSDSGSWPLTEELTAGFVYLRLHGSPHTYASRYGPDGLAYWADRICSWQAGGEPEDPKRITDQKPPRRKQRDVYVYFDNDYEANATQDAMQLTEMLTSESGVICRT
jgi:uncharacterized protein YecE (DUF72 family)